MTYLEECAKRITEAGEKNIYRDWICGGYPTAANLAIEAVSPSSSIDDDIAELVQLLSDEVERLRAHASRCQCQPMS